jgi:serine phosphatase RsbU (regulator of sigma subunit)
MHLDIAVAKVRKYAVPESGDTIETIERPNGGISIVVVDGQRSGRSAKAISNMVARKAVSLLAEGVRDGAAARAAHDYLYTQRSGKVSATLNIASVDLDSRSLVLSRNSHCPIIVSQQGEPRLLDEPSNPVGVHKGTKPVITEIPLAPATIVVIYTDGLIAAGERTGQSLDVLQAMRDLIPHHLTARQIARDLLDRALTLDDHRPADDISLVVMSISKFDQRNDVRWLNVSMPL